MLIKTAQDSANKAYLYLSSPISFLTICVNLIILSPRAIGTDIINGSIKKPKTATHRSFSCYHTATRGACSGSRALGTTRSSTTDEVPSELNGLLEQVHCEKNRARNESRNADGIHRLCTRRQRKKHAEFA